MSAWGTRGFSAPVTWTLVAVLLALGAFAAWDRARRPAYRGVRFLRQTMEDTSAAWCLETCEAFAGVRCYDEEALCRRHLPTQPNCTIEELRTRPLLVWRYQCMAASLGRAQGSDAAATAPSVCLIRCF